jgi:beta-lactamase superfamily II metal-dependent hydrolase
MIAGFVWPMTMQVLQPPLRLLASSMLSLADTLAGYSPQLSGVSAQSLAGVCGAILVLLFGVRWAYFEVAPEWFSRGRRNIKIAAALVGVGAVAPFLIAVPRQASDALRITFLSVGRGSASVVEFPDGTVWLVDCGTSGSYDVGATTIVPFLIHHNETAIDRVIISHPNLDHYSGLPSVLDRLRVGPVTINPWFESFAPKGGPADALLRELKRRRHPLETHSEFHVQLAGVAVETLWPLRGDHPDSAPDSANNASTVLRFRFHGQTILFCGDIEASAMDELLRRGGLEADVLVLPHHGSVESNTDEFIAAVRPRVCVRSTHQRSGESSERFRQAIGEIPLFNTADDGAVTVRLSESSIEMVGHHPKSRAPLLIARQESVADSSIQP